MLPTDTDQNKITEEETKQQKVENKIKEKLEEVEKSENKKDEEKNESDKKSENLSPFLTSAIQDPENKVKAKLESVTKDESENNKDVIFSANCNLYRFVPGKATLEARGVGKIYISMVSESDLYKIVMNRDKINRLACNHYVSPCADLTPHKTIKNLWIWHTFSDTSDKDSKLDSKQTFAVLIKDETKYNEFKEKYEFAKDHNAKKIKQK